MLLTEILLGVCGMNFVVAVHNNILSNAQSTVQVFNMCIFDV